MSHLFALEGIGGNIPAIIFTDNGEFKGVIPAGGPGDIPIIGGQAFMLDAQQMATIAVSPARGGITRQKQLLPRCYP